MSLTAFQAATILTCHEFLTKFLVTNAYRMYIWIGPNKEEYKSSRMIKDLCAAQLNCSEYSALLAAPMFYLSAVGVTASPLAVLLSVTGQIGSFWLRFRIGYPTIPAATFGTARYAGLLLLCMQLVGLAFPKEGGSSDEL